MGKVKSFYKTLAKNGNCLERPGNGSRYCNLENEECERYGRVYSDDGGYICAYCGGRVSKWLPIGKAIAGEEI